MFEPMIDADTRPYWDGVARGELLLQHCLSCTRAIFYPRAVCPLCFSTELEWRPASGTGTVYSYTVLRRAFGRFATNPPTVVALVDLDEGVRMMTHLVEVDPADVRIGSRVKVTVKTVEDGLSLPCFTPIPQD
ncbi:hypothetical protein Acsp03_66810 [Actinomadura sp. NBRC 104412]|uniref:Zn-ribbon domain-containing OB-fold protein n=1 Tax=Actinomadura sp. NBRC 104412 TaxID=3032203 RepID=UPI0024A4AB2A|nr:Zn-ribbon domain-containing OB-fold protein [Actinomadura sp. NBRC 104412]GLZ09215.1 hypothetical protein Acsp03_66810 [Actinomadura sp. NBRC 104412]